MAEPIKRLADTSASDDNMEGSKVVYRFFTSAASDPAIECKIVSYLADKGISPKILHQTAEYRVDQYIDGRAIKRTEIPMYAVPVAKMIRGIHDLDSELKQMHT